MPNRLALRKEYRALRAEISADERQHCAESATKLLIQHPIFTSSRHIACYFAQHHEFATEPLMQAIWQAGKICYLPVMTDTKALHFAQFDQGDELQLNQYFIPEPVSSHHIIHPEKLDLVIVPLVVFDRDGNRIGTGGGYYDRTFAFLYTRVVPAPILLGLGFSCQQSNEIEPQPWDIKMNGLLTEQQLVML